MPTGLLIYKQLPENHYPHVASFDLETFTYAWRWTGDRKYLDLAVRLMELQDLWHRPEDVSGVFLKEAPEGALYQEVRHFRRDSHFLLDYRFELPFLQLLDELDVLKQFEPRSVDLSGLGKA